MEISKHHGVMTASRQLLEVKRDPCRDWVQNAISGKLKRSCCRNGKTDTNENQSISEGGNDSTLAC